VRTSQQAPLDDATAWREHAAELASLALNTLVVDRHHWYVIRRPQERVDGQLAIERSGTLTGATVSRHFEGVNVQDLLVVSGHAVIPSYHGIGGFGWLGFSLEPERGLDDTEARRLSWNQTLKLAEHLSNLGLSVLVEDANGLGTYHIWLVLQWNRMQEWEEIKAIPAVAFIQRVLENNQLAPSVFSPWLPLPGRHHSELWWSRFWRNGEWLRGQSAVDALRSIPTNAVSLIAEVCGQYLTRPLPNTTASHSLRSEKSTSGVVQPPEKKDVQTISTAADGMRLVPRTSQLTLRPLLKHKAVGAIIFALFYGIGWAINAESLHVGLIVVVVFVALMILFHMSDKFYSLKDDLEVREKRDKIAGFRQEVAEITAKIETEKDPATIDFLRSEIIDFEELISDLEDDEAWPNT
jgi:hypothetical protein